jgi:peptidoglycan/xylan/chitin deacetylase (PgdA/CDA1 family)
MKVHFSKLHSWVSVLLLIAGFILIGSCQLPLGQAKTGNLVITTGDGDSKTIGPDMRLVQPSSYRITGEGPGGAVFGPLLTTDGSVEIKGLLEGEWSITVEGLNAESPARVVASATQTVLIRFNETTMKTFRLAFMEGAGSLELSIAWSDRILQVDEVRIVATPAIAGMENLVLKASEARWSDSDGTWSFSRTFGDLPTGSYSFTISFHDASGTRIGPPILESAHVFDGIVSTGTVDMPLSLFPVEAPAVTPDGGEFRTPQLVSITAGSGSAKIYYTLDGSEPTLLSTRYTAPFTISDTADLKVIAVQGNLASDSTTHHFAINNKGTGQLIVDPSLYTVRLEAPAEWQGSLRQEADVDAVLRASVSPAPPEGAVTWTWLLDGKVALNRSGGIASTGPTLQLGKYALDVATPAEFHTFTLEMKADGYTYRDSLTIQSFTPPVLPNKDLVILMYHQLVSGTASSEYTRSVADFENDLIYLRDNGYAIISLEELLEIQKGEKPMPEGKLVTISFDDGAANIYSLAFPLLKAYGAKASFFVNTSTIGTAGKMTWANLREMAAWRDAEGKRLIAVNSHSLNHVALKKAELDFPGDPAGYLAFLTTQMGQSKAAIESNIPAADRGPMFLALPYGDGSGDPAIINVAKSLGYKGIRTSDALARNIASNKNFALPSVVVTNAADIAGITKYYRYP